MRLVRTIGSLGLSVVALGITLVVCEGAVRLLDGQPLLAVRLPPPRSEVPLARPLDPTIGGALLGEIDPAWLATRPPALPRAAVDSEFAAYQQAAIAGGARPLETLRVWNRNLVERTACTAGSTFRKLPPPLLVFDPSGPTMHPPYRYRPGLGGRGGLVTNRFGWRGPDLPVDKPTRTVRLAFVGASTTVGLHGLPFSYPEYVVHWLNLWATRNRLDVHFDGINAGREGIWVFDIEAIIRNELLPFEPDLVLFYEGGNRALCSRRQFSLRGPRTAARPPPGRGWHLAERIVAATGAYSVLARRLEVALVQLKASGGLEPAKPSLEIEWPTGLDEAEPDLTSPTLPTHLTEMIGALDTSRRVLAANGGELAVSTYVLLAHEGLRLDPRRDAMVYHSLNELCWPLRYADMRRDMDLNNRVLERYAAAAGVPFIDVAGAFPPDPSLFFDAVHFNDNGTRVHAWIVFRALLPIVRERLQSGAWPRPDRVAQSQQTPITPSVPFMVSCP
jgi:hypothetical protein